MPLGVWGTGVADVTWDLQETCSLLLWQLVARQDAWGHFKGAEDIHACNWIEPSVSG